MKSASAARIKHGAHQIDLSYVAPSPGNAKAKARFDANRFSVTRQLRYTPNETQRALDVGQLNDHFGNIPWTDADRVHRLITEDIPERVAADAAYTNARKHSDPQNARIEHDKALQRVMTALLKDDTELFKQFVDNESFRRWLTDTVFGMTYDAPVGMPAVAP